MFFPINFAYSVFHVLQQGVHCPTDAELASLPHIRREQITLSKFLGSGAFGEVFEGVARQINGSTVDTKVAVKVSTLASEVIIKLKIGHW